MRGRIPGSALGPSALALVALAAVASVTVAEQNLPDYSALAGERTYKTYCASCHGVKGEGDGYIAETLRKKPTDLTGLSARNDGNFPEARVQAVIDGQEEVRAHGSREMPVWGDVLLWPEGDSPERRELVKRKIGELIAHLRTIQRSGEQKD